jgi:hypothetical protein
MVDGLRRFTSDRRAPGESSWTDQVDWKAGTAENVDVTVDGIVGCSPRLTGETPDSVVHRFRFEESVTDSVGSLGASTSGGVIYNTSNPLEGNASVVGDGVDNEVLFDSNVNVDATQNGIAFEFFANFDTVDSGIFSISDQNTEWNLDFPSSGTLRAFYQSTGNNPTVSTTVQTGIQTRVVVQYDPATGAIEIGTGESIDDANNNGGTLDTPNNDNVFLNTTVGGSNSYADGIFDDLRVHNEPIL